MTDRVIRSDAEQFEVFKANGEDINLNRFLTLLIVGYYNGYKQETNETAETIKEIISHHIKENRQKEELTEQLMDQVIQPEVLRRKGKQSVSISLKPTYDTDQIITEINQSLIGSSDYISQYLRRMLMKYCEKPIYERERIVFKEHVEFLENACKSKREISFTTAFNPGQIHHVIPYELTYGPEERFNYLLGQEYNERYKRNKAVSYRLCRIQTPSFSFSSGVIEEEVVKHLKQTKKYSPAYAINEDAETCVRLSERGQQNFRVIYFGRPIVDRKEKLGDGSALYYFHSSIEQIFRYFLRFTAGEAEVLYPDRLRNNLKIFHENALRIYKDGKDED